MRIPATILAEDRHRRIEALRALPLDRDAIFALRSALLVDEDGEARAVAAERLATREVVSSDGPVRAAVRFALLDALGDPRPAVRESAAFALGRHFESECEPRVVERFAEMLEVEPAWRVRRAVVRAVVAVASSTAVPLLARVLDDPFWRVRYAAIQALAAHPNADLTPARRGAAVAFVRAVWRGETQLLEEPASAEQAPQTIEADDVVADEDPAVMAVRLARLPDEAVSGTRLVALLASPHDVLRRLARRRLVRRAHDDEIRAVLALLDEPRTPYATEEVRRVMARVDTRGLRTSLLSEGTATAAALAWAIDETCSRRDVDVIAERHVGHPDPRVRRAALAAWGLALPTKLLVARAADDDPRMRALCIEALALRAADDEHARSFLDASDVLREAPVVARVLVASSVRREQLRAGLEANDPETRRRALENPLVALTEEERERLARDPDPWIRGAVLDARTASLAVEGDPDPSVRRLAFETVRRRPETQTAVLLAAARSDDAWTRARAADALRCHADAETLARLLLLTRDEAPMVRASAAEALAKHEDVGAHCLALVAREPAIDEELRLAAHGRLVLEGTAATYDALAHDLRARPLSPRTYFALLGMTLAYPEALREGSELVFEGRAPWASPERPRASAPEARRVAKRPLGETGLEVAPLGISGAFDLAPRILERARDAGVNLFFWEPEYRALTEAIARDPRRSDLVVMAGTYEADAKTIARDVDRALSRLRLESLGVMLLFWVRSPARLSDEAFDALARLKERGKVRAIGFSTHHRELAAEAIACRPWDVVMARHSAAHPALETTLLPLARERKVAVITFSNLVYGRLLGETLHGERVEAVDCYRYSLAQPGVTACLSAPRRQRELEANLGALYDPTLDDASIARLREHGKHVRAANRAFLTHVREAL